MIWGGNDAALDRSSARLYQLPEGFKRIRMSLPADSCAVLLEKEKCIGIHWAGTSSMSKTIENRADSLMLLHTGNNTAHSAIAVTAIPDTEALRPIDTKTIFSRHFSAGGEFRQEIVLTPGEKKSGIRLNTMGEKIESVFMERTGRIKRGKNILVKDNGILDIRHGSGIVVSWLEGGENDPWQLTENEVYLSSPTQFTLAGSSLKANITDNTASMVHMDIPIPVVVCIYSGKTSGRVELFPDGGNMDIFLPSAEKSSQISITAIGEQKLAGAVHVYSTNIIAIKEGTGPEFQMGPGDSRLFSFSIDKNRTIGMGVRGSSDIAVCRLLESTGKILGTGVVQMHKLKKGDYFLAVEIPSNGFSVNIQPVLVGTEPPESPPPDVVRKYLEMSGLKYEGKKL
jgi:hypothetical protein